DHVRHAVELLGIVRLVQVLALDIAHVRYIAPVDLLEQPLARECFDHVFRRLDEVVFGRTAQQLREHLFVRGVRLVVHADASLLGELVEHRLRHILRPREEIQLLRGRQRGTGRRGSGRAGEDERTEWAFHHHQLQTDWVVRMLVLWCYRRARFTASEAISSTTVKRINRVESALIIGLSPFFTRPKISTGNVAEPALLTKNVTISSSRESANAINAPETMAGIK